LLPFLEQLNYLVVSIVSIQFINSQVYRLYVGNIVQLIRLIDIVSKDTIMTSNDKNVVEAIGKLHADLNTRLDLIISLLEDIKKG
jgi:hypothetical protein